MNNGNGRNYRNIRRSSHSSRNRRKRSGADTFLLPLIIIAVIAVIITSVLFLNNKPPVNAESTSTPTINPSQSPTTSPTPSTTASPSPTPEGDFLATPGPNDEMLALYDKIVMLDAGHGGVDGGNPVGDILEKDLNLSIVLKVYDLFENSDTGIKVFLTRSDDTYIHKNDRPPMANGLADLFVSVHCDFYESSSDPNGVQVNYDQAGEATTGRYNITNAKFAQLMQTHLVNNLKTRDRFIRGDLELTICVRSTMPAVLIEVGFMSNPDELQKLISDEFQNKAAKAIYDAIVEAFGYGKK